MPFQFSPAQIEKLVAKLDGDNVKTRSQANRTFSYIEAWKTIAEANRIFGFDGWRRETVSIVKLVEIERKVGKKELPGWGVGYMAKVRVTVGDPNDGGIVREGTGCGQGIDVDLVQAHESAVKEAESDAMKRALMTFGNPFGLALYDKNQSEVEWDKPEAHPATAPGPDAAEAAKLRESDDDLYVNGFCAWVAEQSDPAFIHAAWSQGAERYHTLSPARQARLQAARDEALRRLQPQAIVQIAPPSAATAAPYVKSPEENWIDEVIAWMDDEPSLDAIQHFWKKDAAHIRRLPPDLLAALERAKDKAKQRITGAIPMNAGPPPNAAPTPKAGPAARIATTQDPVDLDDEIQW